MEMCYDGALVMPSNYAVMNEDEMTYLEGGIKCKTLGKIIDCSITVISFMCGVGSGVKMIREILRRNSKGAIMVLTSTALRWAGISLASNVVSGLYAVLTAFTNYTIGNAIAYGLDRIDRVKCDGNVAF